MSYRTSARVNSKAAKTLLKYRSIRNFEVTLEPSGKYPVVSAKQLRFVIQKHAASRLHYDFRLEWNGVFKSWALTRGPSLNPSDKRLAVQVEDHPLDYGDFEGTIPRGQYGGGTVMLWDRGTWKPREDAAKMLKNGKLIFWLNGKKLHGNWILIRMRNHSLHSRTSNWLLIKHRDKFASDGAGDAILKKDRSVASGRTMEAIKAGRGPKPTPFMRTKPFQPRAKSRAKPRTDECFGQSLRR